MKQCLQSVNHEQFPIQMKQDNKHNNWLEILDFQPKLFWRTPTKLHRQLPKLNKFCLGVQLNPSYQVIKKAQNGSFVSLHAVSHFMTQRLQNVIKKKQKGHASY